MREMTICPFRTYTEVRPALTVGTGDITITGFMDCLKSKCPAFDSFDKPIPCTGMIETVEICKRLEVR